MNQFPIVSNCPLCGEHSLHVIGEGEQETMQCIACGYATGYKFRGFQDDTNEAYKSLTPEMKNWSMYTNGRVWIPSVMSLPFGMLYPIDVDNNVTHQKEMKWAWAEMVDIPIHEQENYPDTSGGYYTKRIDVDNQILLTGYLEGMAYINERADEILKKESKPSKLKLPKLNKK